MLMFVHDDEEEQYVLFVFRIPNDMNTINININRTASLGILAVMFFVLQLHEDEGNYCDDASADAVLLGQLKVP